jgi:hypothetical protein
MRDVRLTKVERLLLPLILLVALLVRMMELRNAPLWEDEAESSINGLSILQHGVPTESYLGLPIFENTLVRTWEGHPEYEFRDISYSDRGVAVYHGWLPLYAIATALRIAGIEPDQPERRTARTNNHEIWLRTYVPRIPSVLFGLISMLALFAAARRLYGREAGWAALLLAALVSAHVEMSTQARYYGATLATHSLCAWMMTAVWQDGRRRYWLGLAVSLILLFHSHLVTFAVVCVAFSILLPWVSRQPGFWKNILLAGSLGAAGTVPWLILSGFLGHSTNIPHGWTLLTFPNDLFVYPKQRPMFAVLYAAGFIVTSVAVLIRKKETRIGAIFGAHARTLAWLYAWMLVAYGMFFACMPAASFFFDRISVPLLVPALLLAAVVLAGFVRLAGPKYSPVLIAPVTLIFLLVAGVRLAQEKPEHRGEWRAVRTALQYLSELRYDPETRFYATPNEHLVLTYYSGLPVQSIAPVRKKFLESYKGPIVLFEKEEFHTQPASWLAVQAQARAAGIELSQTDAEKLAARLGTLAKRRRIVHNVMSVFPRLESLPAYTDADRFARTRDEEERSMAKKSLTGNPLFRAFEMTRFSDWWKLFFYRFVDPKSRMGAGLNYARRISNSSATVVPGWVIYYSPAPCTTQLTGEQQGSDIPALTFSAQPNHPAASGAQDSGSGSRLTCR